MLSRTTIVLRKYIFDKDYKAFEGSFSTECQDTFLPSSFKLLTNILLLGTFIDSRKEKLEQPMLINLQLIAYNNINRSHQERTFHRLFKIRESPLFMYLWMLIHAKARRKCLMHGCPAQESQFLTHEFSNFQQF